MKTKLARDIGIGLFLAVLIYTSGYLLLRTQFVKLSHQTDGHLVFQSDALMYSTTVDKAVNWYRPGFHLEAAFRGGDRITINPWAAGMRSWSAPFSSLQN